MGGCGSGGGRERGRDNEMRGQPLNFSRFHA